MPELPEVETYRRYFEATSLRRRIASVDIAEPRILAGIGPAALRRRLSGRRFTAAERHGKHLFARVDGDAGYLTLHFGMTGDLAFVPAREDLPAYARFSVAFEGGGRLAYTDPRKFGRVGWTPDMAAFVRARKLGPDPLRDDIGFDRFREMLRGRRGAVKAAFLDQRFLAGIGNLYADEILFRAGVRPDSRANRLTAGDLERVFAAIPAVLDAAVRRNAGAGGPGEVDVFGFRDAARPCPRCGGRVRRTVIAGRTTYYCSRHQKKR